MNNKSAHFSTSPAQQGRGSLCTVDHELVIATTFGTLLSVVYAVGVSGNVYTLVVMCQSIRLTTPMYISIINLSTYFLKDWYFEK